MIGLFRTSQSTEENRRHGLTQFLVDMKNTNGITVNPIHHMTGIHEFNEVVFEDAFVPEENVLGDIDAAWKQATSELAYERSGPERFLETIYILTELVRALGDKPDARGAEGIGRLVAQLHTLRRMSVSVNGMLQAGKEPTLEGSIVKDLGTNWEQDLPAKARQLAAFVDDDAGNRADFDELCHHDCTEAHHPGWDARDPSRYHRTRSRSALERQKRIQRICQISALFFRRRVMPLSARRLTPIFCAAVSCMCWGAIPITARFIRLVVAMKK